MQDACERFVDEGHLSNCLGEAKSRDMPSLNEKDYSDEIEDKAQTEEEEGWHNRTQSPIAGRISGTMEELERIQSSSGQATSDEVSECIKDSFDCYKTCTETTIRCLNLGGKHAKIENLNLLMDCAKMCSANADFMLRNSTYYPQVCGITADICDECADICERFDDDFMKECASACRRCAESCREMAR
ncbi:MAG: four-helix bundle copper-binding protein [Candidatus Bathyarchaeota archaeon]|nr:four-helix bundle copper-binding protein [Candidatus Bathyarchaeota archaeon]